MLNSMNRRNSLTLFVVCLFSFTMVVVPSVNGAINNVNDNKFSIKATDVYNEDFEDVTYRNGTTTAFGWGTGTITNARDFTWKELDFQESKYALTDIDVEGKRVYAASYNDSSASPSIVVFDISNTYEIRQTGERNSFQGQMSIAADGDVVYVGQDKLGGSPGTINTYYWTDPFSSGSWVSTTDSDGAVTDIELNGHLAYYTSFDSSSGYSLRVLYAENPDVPVNITASWMDSSKAMGLAVESNLAYVAAEEDGFYVVNVSNINNFFTEGFVDTPGNAADVVVDGRYGYLAAGDAGIFSIDLIDKTNPQIIGHIDTPGHAHKLVLQGNTLFVADGSGVVVLDVADPHNPTYVTRNFIAPYVYDVDLFGGTLVVGSADGLHTYTIQAGDGIADISETCYENSYSERQAWDVRVRGDIAFVAGGPDGFYTLNVKDPNNPILLDNYSIPVSESFFSIDIDGNLAHLITDDRWSIFDISDPTDIKFVNDGFGTNLKDVYAHGGMVYIAIEGYVDIINCTDPYNFVILDFLSVSSNISSVWVEGRYLYAAEYTDGSLKTVFWVYDITDFTTPVLVGTETEKSQILDLYVDGDIGYASHDGWSLTFNLTDPTLPFWADWVGPPSSGTWGFGPYQLSANPSGSVDIINATNIEATYWLHTNQDASSAWKVTTNGDFTYVANKSSLVILRHFLSAGDTYVLGTTFAQSLEVDSVDDIIDSAALNPDDFLPLDTHIDYFISADGGANWEAVTPGVEHIFANPGSDLRWRAEITGPEDRSPHLYEITIDFFYTEAGTSSPTFPWWAYVIIGGGVIFITLIIVIVVVVSKKKVATR